MSSAVRQPLPPARAPRVTRRRGPPERSAEGKITVNPAHNGMQSTRLERAVWRKSHHSNPSGNCVEIAELPDGGIAVRNSRYPDGPALIYSRAEIAAFLRGAKDGEFDSMLA